jgi:hypothetical protein
MFVFPFEGVWAVDGYPSISKSLRQNPFEDMSENKE